MYLIFKDKNEFDNFNNQHFIKIDSEQLLQGVTWHKIEQEKFKFYQNQMKLYLKYNLLVTALDSLYGNYIAININPFEIIKELETLVGHKEEFKLPLKSKLVFLDYQPLEIEEYLQRLPNPLDVKYLKPLELDIFLKQEGI